MFDLVSDNIVIELYDGYSVYNILDERLPDKFDRRKHPTEQVYYNKMLEEWW